MKIFYKKSNLIRHLNELRPSSSTIGFVPTMGALHLGHLSLIKQCLNNNKISVVSIFVNPTQFNNTSDLITYPKNLNKDIKLLEKLSKDIIIFSPKSTEIYSEKITTNKYDFNGLDKFMEGEFRSNHFQGVATVVELLLGIVKPNSAYFGEKDFQQLAIIRSLKNKVNIVGCPTLRDVNGLALSSRNIKLSDNSKTIASNIFKNLNFIKSNFHKSSLQNLIITASNNINSFDEMNLEYLEIAEEDKLVPINMIKTKKKYRAFISVFVDGIRLIDNIAVN
tara:strand:- start:2892 stop:3728 length:837 start_codon:yes stop_codon:yes gene_type:complete